MKPLVSVITPAYNCENYLQETIESVLAQTYENWEMWIVDDASTDQSVALIKSYVEKDPRIHLIALEVNHGAAICRNKGIEASTGRYIAFLDSDDMWMEDKLEKQVAFMRSHEYPFTFTTYEHVNEVGEKTGKLVVAQEKVSYDEVLLRSGVGNSTVLLDKYQISDLKIPNIRKRNDDALFLKVLRQVPYAYGLDTSLMRYRVRKGSISSNKFSLVKYHWILYRKHEHLSWWKSIFLILHWGYLKIIKRK